MPITAHINHTLGIRVHRIFGRATASEFLSLIEYYRGRPRLAQTDMVNIIEEDADSPMTAADLAVLKTELNRLHESLKLAIIRRSAWVCPNVRVWPVLEAWLHGRHSLDGAAAELCLVSSLEDAKCLFDEDELAAVRHGVGFVALQHFEHDGGVVQEKAVRQLW